MYKYMREDTPDDWKIKKLQEKILEIAVYLDEFCSENDIQYCLMGGSALGAVRHKGFIPWDDDLDIFMTPDSYEKFVRLFNEKGDKNRFLLEPFGEFDNMITLGKIRLRNTTYIESALLDYMISHNIYIDIFILHDCPDNSAKRMYQYVWAKYIIAKGQSVKDLSRYGIVMRTALNLLKCFPRLLGIKFALKQVYKFRGQKSKYFCNYLGKAKYKRGTYKKEWFAQTKRVPFEKVTLCVPVGIEEFLSERFGDYMQLPDIEQIKREQHASIWDTEKDYKEYIKNSPTLPRKYVF